MRLELRLQSTTNRPWRDILKTVPPPYVLTDGTEGELVFRKAQGATTGVRLLVERGCHIVALPAFAHATEMLIAVNLVKQTAAILGATILVRGQAVPISTFQAMETQIAQRFVEDCGDIYKRIAGTARDEVFAIDGYARPYYLGRETAARVTQLAKERDGGDIYERLTMIVGAFQELAPPTVFPPPLRVRTPDGQVAVCAAWNPSEETLLPACDFLLVIDADGVPIRVARGEIAGVVEPYGALIDERQWMLGTQTEDAMETIRQRARAVGRRIRLPALG